MNSGFKAHFLVFVATCMVAGSFISSNALANFANPISLTLLRFLVAALFLAPFALYKKERIARIPSTMPRAMIIGLFYSAAFVGFFEALKTTTPLKTGTLLTLLPLITALLAAIVLKSPLNRKHVLVYVVGAIGTLWVIFEGDVNQLTSFSLNNGDLLFRENDVS